MSRSFSDPDTRFHLERSDTPVNVDGFKLGEFTGVVICLACGESHKNVDEIPHSEHCPQRFVHSRFYAESMLAE
ncbi:MAG: hypothetical protein ACOCR0_03505 [Haloferacaceae archaeon]